MIKPTKLAVCLSVCTFLAVSGVSHAAPSSSATQTFDATLSSYVDIQASTTGATLSTTIDSTDGTLSANLVSVFNVTANEDSQTVYLQATANTSDTGAANALFQDGSDNVYIMLGNTGSGNQPASAALTDCANNGSANPNVIAYQISSLALNNSATSEYDGTLNQYEITMDAGETTATTTTATAAYGDTYTFDDLAGSYQAVLTMTTTSL